MGRKGLANVPKLDITAIKKASGSLNILKKSSFTNNQTSSPVTQSLYPVTECLQYLKNLYTQPTYKKLTITAYAWAKLMAFIHLVGDYEISGFGRIQDDKVTDFDIIKQEVRSTYVESDADAVLDFIMNVPQDQRTEWTLDWHSHVEMGTTPSSTDWKNYYEMLQARQFKQFPAMIVNKKGNVTANQIICENKHTDITVYVETTPLEESEIEKIYQICKDRVQHYCTKAIVTSSWSGYGATTGFTGRDYDDDEYYYGWQQKKTSDSTINSSKEDEDKPRINMWDLSEAEIRKMEANGIVFDYETGDAYEEDECCQECLKPLKTETELEYGVCFDCFQKALKKEAVADHSQNS